MSIATHEDVKTSLLRDLDEVESRFVGDMLDRAERIIQARAPDIIAQAYADPSFYLAATIADVEAEAVARVFRAPKDGAGADRGIYTRESLGDYSYNVNMLVASGLLDILDAEWTKLGVSSYGSVMPETDGYARSRFGVPPEWRFQFGWGGGDQIPETIWRGTL